MRFFIFAEKIILGGENMARCPYLDYESTGWASSQGNYICKICKRCISEDEVKNKCKVDYGEYYKDCPIYKNR